MNWNTLPEILILQKNLTKKKFSLKFGQVMKSQVGGSKMPTPTAADTLTLVVATSSLGRSVVFSTLILILINT